MDTPTQPQQPTGTADGPANGPPTLASTPHLGALITELDNQLATLAGTIDENQASVKSATQQKRQLQADLVLLKRVSAALDATREETQAVLTEASKAEATVQDRIDALPTAEKTAIDEALAPINAALSNKEQALATAEEELDARRQKVRDLERQLAAQKETADTAYAHLSDLAAELRQLAARLKRATNEMTAAAATNQDRKVYILGKDLEAMRAQVTTLLNDNAIKARLDAYTRARSDLAAARKSLDDSLDAVSTHETEVATRLREVNVARSSRTQQLKPLFTAPKEEATTPAPA